MANRTLLNRRNYLKQLAVATGSLVTLPSWAIDWNQDQLSGTSSCFNEAEEKLLSALSDAILPPGTEGIGALSTGVDQFLYRLFTDCYETQVQDRIKLQLQQISQKAMKDYGKSFENCQTGQKMSIMEQFACSDDEGARETFQLIKGETIRGFRTSKVVMTEYHDYQVIPGHFYGCVELNS